MGKVKSGGRAGVMLDEPSSYCVPTCLMNQMSRVLPEANAPEGAARFISMKARV